jgi:hypothetical protein
MNTVERLVDANVGRVWNLVCAVERWDQMLPTIQKVSRLDAGGPVGLGARFEVRQPGLPKAVYEITEWDAGSGFTWVSSSPGVSTTASHRLQAESGQTRLTLGIAWTGPLAGLVRLLLGTKARRMVEQEAEAFTRLAERGDVGDAAR